MLVALGIALVSLCAPVAQGGAAASGAAEVCPPVAPAPSTPHPPVIEPTTAPAPAQVLACVGAQPITGATFEHWANVARKDEGTAPSHPATSGEVASEVMGFLISSDWVLDEARALHLHVSASQVRRAFDRIRKQQFHKISEFRTFLRRSGQTVDDLLFRVRLNLLSGRIQKHVLAGRHSNAAKQRALLRFVTGFKQRWQARTVCVPGYTTGDCGRLQAAPL
jgi:hypothetical protein